MCIHNALADRFDNLSLKSHSGRRHSSQFAVLKPYENVEHSVTDELCTDNESRLTRQLVLSSAITRKFI